MQSRTDLGNRVISAGRAGYSLCPSSRKESAISTSSRLSRRVFLQAAAATCAAGALVACGGGGSSGDALDPTRMYRLSARGKRASNAAKANAANKLFATQAAAEAGRAHPGDRSVVVPLDVSPATWDQLFLGGARLTVDQRSL